MATDYKAKFQKARGARKVEPRGRGVIEITSMDAATQTLTGTIIDGVGAGGTLTWVPAGGLNWDDYTRKAKTKLDVPGAIMRVENMERARPSKNAPFATKHNKDPWTKTLIAHPSKVDDRVLTGQVMKTTIYEPKNKPDYMMVNLVDLKAEKFCTDIEAFRSAVLEAYASVGGFTMFAVDPLNKPMDIYYYRKVEQKDSGYDYKNTPEQDVAEFFANLGDDGVEAMKEILAHKGISVAPTRSVRVGTDTWNETKSKNEEAKLAGKLISGAPIEFADFAVSSIGGRFARALADLTNEGQIKRVVDAFLAQANDDQKLAFGKDGFAGISDEDMQSFLQGRGVNLIEVTNDGYNSGSVIIKPYDPEKPQGNVMVVKVFPVYAPTPLPGVEAFKDIRTAYYAEMEQAVKTVLEGPAKTVEAAAPEAPKAEVKAEAAPEAQAPVETSAPVSQEEADIDSLLDEIDNGRL